MANNSNITSKEEILYQFGLDVYYQTITLLNPKTNNKLTDNEIMKGETPFIGCDFDEVKKLAKSYAKAFEDDNNEQ